MLIPKIFQNQSFEAKEVAEELAKKSKAEEDAKAMAKKSAASKRATVAPTKKKTHQKPTKDTKTTEKTTAPAPAEEDAPVRPRPTVTATLYSPEKLRQRVLTRSTL